MPKLEIRIDSPSDVFEVIIDGKKYKNIKSGNIFNISNKNHIFEFKDGSMFGKSGPIDIKLDDNEYKIINVNCWDSEYQISFDNGNLDENEHDSLEEEMNEENPENDISDNEKTYNNKNIEEVSSQNFHSKIFAATFWLTYIIIVVVCFFSATSSNNADLLEVGSIAGLGIALVVAGIASVSNETSWSNKYNLLSQKRENQIETLQKSYQLSFVSLTIDGKGICIDESAKKVIVLNGYDDITEIGFNSILSYELRENGNQVIEGKGLETYAAGQLLGQNAALAMASSSRNINVFCNELVIHIYLKNIENDNLKIELINQVNINKNNPTYKALYDFSKDIVVTLDKVIHLNNEANPSPATTNNPVNNQNNVENSNNLEEKTKSTDQYDELIKLKELLDMNVITQEDYDTKKKEILGIK